MYMLTLVVCLGGKRPDVGASRVEVVGLSYPCLKLADEHLGLLVCNPAFAGGTGQLSDAVVPRLSPTLPAKDIQRARSKACPEHHDKADDTGAFLNEEEVKYFPKA